MQNVEEALRGRQEAERVDKQDRPYLIEHIDTDNLGMECRCTVNFPFELLAFVQE